MEPILKTVAREYTHRYKDLKKICFLFPNKRCGIFLKEYLAKEGIKQEELPHILTITEFMGQIAKLTEAPRIQQLFTLFNIYKEMLRGENQSETDDFSESIETEISFEDFRNWGETVLSDFNTVDMYLTNPDEIFKNIKDYRELSTNFLTEEQKEVMQAYFGISTYEDDGEFWKTFKDFENLPYLQEKFINLWQILSPLHKKFIDTLEKDGLGTTGSIYRKAAEKIEERGNYPLPFYKKIVVVGFNALTEAERAIFKKLQKEKGYEGYDEYIDFVWDFTGPLLKDPDFTSSRFVAYNSRMFPSPEWMQSVLKNQEVEEYPEITIISAPSLTSQTKIAGEIIRNEILKEGIEMFNDAEVALILPDESLLSNMLYSFPEELKSINLTMSYNLRQTPIANFMNLLRRLYSTSRESDKGNIFFVKDLKLFFTHPYSYLLLGEETIEKVREFIERNRKISFSVSEMEEDLPSLDLLNIPSKKAGKGELFDYLYKMLEVLITNFGEEENLQDEKSQIIIYTQYLKELQEVMEHYKIELAPYSVFQISDRLIGSEKIGFEGEPLYGLQVMGTLESRSLDFRHVIVLSMNEGLLPRKAMTSTFIPETLRKAFGLPPARYSEDIFGYYFYRLMSRAEKVTLIYDGRTLSGTRGGESRYLLQLKEYVPSSKLKEESWQYTMKNRVTGDASVEKTPEIKEMLECYSTAGSHSRNLSASTLTNYRKCEVQFFLRNLLNINTDPDQSEYIDSITIGNILHEVMMDLYLPHYLQRKLLQEPKRITVENLESLINDKTRIRGLVDRKIKKLFLRRDEEDGRIIEAGSLKMVAQQIENLIVEILKYDQQLAPFNLYGCEIDEILHIKMKSGRVVNFRFAIDRLDEIIVDGEPTLRIVDYKTGKKKREVSTLESVFEEGSGDQIFQLFLYAWLLNKRGMKGSENVMTEIYYVPDLISGIGGHPKIGKNKVKSYSEYSEEFSQRLEELIEGIFTKPVFSDKAKASQCLYCAFRTHCGK